jgi:heptaprenylglyceryl phosphate synthase
MHIFTDSDWAGNELTRRSTTGYVVFAAGGPIAWQSKLQKTVSTSSMQAAYQAENIFEFAHSFIEWEC